MQSLSDWSTTHRTGIQAYLGTRFQDAWPPPFVERLQYPIFTGGKRVRPLLTVAAFQAIQPDAPVHSAVYGAGSAVELIHTYSLVHDDLPDMDDDDERRGRPTVHVAYDPATAILVGDALLTEAFSILASLELSAQTRVDLVQTLGRAAGYFGMIGGQAADVGIGGPVTDVDALVALHRGKTGALIEASVVMGGLVAQASAAQLEKLTAYGKAVGLAFQLADDVLDMEEDEGDDGPPSYVKLLGLEETQRRARELAMEAERAAEGLPSASRLLDLARFIIERDV